MDIIAVNNRDLAAQQTSLEHSFHACSLPPEFRSRHYRFRNQDNCRTGRFKSSRIQRRIDRRKHFTRTAFGTINTNGMKQIKVCGLTNNPESKKIAVTFRKWILSDFIFAEQSPRFTRHQSIPSFGKQRVGVFVNASLETIETAIREHQLTAVQLHGDETPDFCNQLPNDIIVIKAFGIADKSRFGSNRCL